jgi:primosomal protein N' (replication factor Y)
VFRAKDGPKAAKAARDFAALLAPVLPAGAEILGPAECPLAVVAGTSRWQLIVRAGELREIHREVGQALVDYVPPSGLRIEPDVDPTSLM